MKNGIIYDNKDNKDNKDAFIILWSLVICDATHTKGSGEDKKTFFRVASSALTVS